MAVKSNKEKLINMFLIYSLLVLVSFRIIYNGVGLIGYATHLIATSGCLYGAWLYVVIGCIAFCIVGVIITFMFNGKLKKLIEKESHDN